MKRCRPQDMISAKHDSVLKFSLSSYFYLLIASRGSRRHARSLSRESPVQSPCNTFIVEVRVMYSPCTIPISAAVVRPQGNSTNYVCISSVSAARHQNQIQIRILSTGTPLEEMWLHLEICYRVLVHLLDIIQGML